MTRQPAPQQHNLTNFEDAFNKLMFRIEQGLLRLLRTKPHRKHQSVVRNSWYCTHLFNSVLSITFLDTRSSPDNIFHENGCNSHCKIYICIPHLEYGMFLIRSVQFFLEKCLKLHSGVWVKTQLHANFFSFGHHHLTMLLRLQKFTLSVEIGPHAGCYLFSDGGQ